LPKKKFLNWKCSFSLPKFTSPPFCTWTSCLYLPPPSFHLNMGTALFCQLLNCRGCRALSPYLCCLLGGGRNEVNPSTQDKVPIVHPKAFWYGATDHKNGHTQKITATSGRFFSYPDGRYAAVDSLQPSLGSSSYLTCGCCVRVSIVCQLPEQNLHLATEGLHLGTRCGLNAFLNRVVESRNRRKANNEYKEDRKGGTAEEVSCYKELLDKRVLSKLHADDHGESEDGNGHLLFHGCMHLMHLVSDNLSLCEERSEHQQGICKICSLQKYCLDSPRFGFLNPSTRFAPHPFSPAPPMDELLIITLSTCSRIDGNKNAQMKAPPRNDTMVTGQASGPF